MTPPLQTPIHILLIDDDVVFCQLLEKGLARLKYSVTIAHNQAQAIAEAQQRSPQVVLLDMRLGEESGLAIIEPLLAEHPDTKIIMLTGYSSLATAVSAVKKGASNYLAKPINVPMVHQTIQASLVETTAVNNAQTSTVSTPTTTENNALPEQSPSLKRLEWEHIQQILEQNDGNISRAAKQLGLHRRTLQRKLKKHAP